MKIILNQDIQGLGRAGEVKSVTDGYARNYLIPKGLAAPATQKSRQILEEKVRQKMDESASEKAEAETLKSKIENLSLEMELKRGKQNEVFGSITRLDLCKNLAKQKINISKDAIDLNKPIKSPGEYSIPIKLHPEISAMLRLVIKSRAPDPGARSST